MDGDCPIENVRRKRRRGIEGFNRKRGGACRTRATTRKWARFAYGFMHQSQPKNAVVGLRVSVILDLAFHLSFSLSFFFNYPFLSVFFYILHLKTKYKK